MADQKADPRVAHWAGMRVDYWVVLTVDPMVDLMVALTVDKWADQWADQ